MAVISYLHYNLVSGPNLSATTAPLKFTDDISSSLDNSMITGAIFIDLTKAFDMVDHYLLLDKLLASGLSRHSLLWFNSYLHNRCHCVSFQGAQSDFMIMEKWAPQGSSLGPLLFFQFSLMICHNFVKTVIFNCMPVILWFTPPNLTSHKYNVPYRLKCCSKVVFL